MSAMNRSYTNLLAQRQLSENGRSTGIDAEFLACHYLVSSKMFKWALKWDDLDFPGDYRWQKIERGIDVIAEHMDGSMWAIQVKDYDKFVDYNAFTKMNAFVQSGERRGVVFDRMAIVCTNKPAGRVLIEVCEENNTVIFDRIDMVKIMWPATIGAVKSMYKVRMRKINSKHLRRRLVKPVRSVKGLRRWQRECMQKAQRHFRKQERGQVYATTGSGKTISFVQFAEDYDTVLVIVPRLLLAQQTFEKFVQQSAKGYDDVLFVASDAPRYDDLRASDLVGRCTTNPKAIAAFMRKPGRKLLISTYKSSGLIAEAKVKLDLAIFDEAHHAAGFQYNGDRPKEAQALLEYDGIERFLFVTATPRIYSDVIKEGAEENGHYIASLDDEEIFGEVIYDYAYGHALNEQTDKVVKPYKIYVVALKDEEYREALEEQLIKDAATGRNVVAVHIVAALALRKLRRKLKLRHILCFTNKIDNAIAMSSYYSEYVGNHFSAALHSRRTTLEANERLLDQFKESPEGFISNVNILGEGMDAPCVDCVVFADPMQSKHAIAQKLGRGLRYDPERPDATLSVIVPVLLNDEDEELDAKRFKTVLNVLGAMGSMDETLMIEIKRIARNKPSSGREPESRLVIDADIPIVDIMKLRKMIATSVYSPARFEWWLRYEEVKACVDDDGYPACDTVIGRWINKQREAYRAGELAQDQIDALRDLPDWHWGNEDSWELNLDRVSKYVSVNGKRPSNDWWLETQISQYKKGELSPERLAVLENALPGWPFADNRRPTTMSWEMIKAWSKEHGKRPEQLSSDPEERKLAKKLSRILNADPGVDISGISADDIEKYKTRYPRNRSGAKLTANEVVEIRTAAVTGLMHSRLAVKYGVSQTTISRIVRGEAYSDCGGPISSRKRS